MFQTALFEGMVLPLLLVVANLTGAGMIVPQVVRLRRHGKAEGVSAAWAGLSFAINLAWVAYAVAESLWGMLPVSIAGVVLYLAIGWELLRITGLDAARRFVLAAVAAALVPSSGFLLGGWTGAGLATGLAYGAQFVPAAVVAVRSVDLSGISRLTWQLAWIEAVIWAVYGVAERDLPLIVGGGGGASVASVILWQLGTSRSQHVSHALSNGGERLNSEPRVLREPVPVTRRRVRKHDPVG